MAEPLSGRKVTHEPEKVLDRAFFAPPGVVGVRNQTYLEALTQGNVDDENAGSDADAEVEASYGDDTQALPEGFIATPQSITIISQRSRTRTDGSTVVDVVVDVADVGNADKYEVRVTRAGMPS